MRKLFYENINITDFTATVVSCEPTTDGNQYRVLLDATAFSRKKADSPQIKAH